MKLHQKLFWLFVFLLPVQLGRHFWPEWSYVLGLKVDYLAPTIYLTDLLVVGILGLWGLEKIPKIKNQKLKTHIKNKKTFFLLFAFFAFLLVNAVFAQNPGAALYKFVKIIEFTLLGFYVAKNKNLLSTIRHPLSLAIIYSALIAIFQFLKQASLDGLFWWLGERTFTSATPGIAKAIIGGRFLMRPYATFPHPNVLAGFTLASLVLLQNTSDGGPKGLLRGGGVRKILQWVTLALGGMAIAISFSRSAWLVGLLVGLWFLAKHLRGKHHDPGSSHQERSGIERYLKGGGILLILLILSLFFYFAPQFSTEEAISQRLQLIKVATRMIRTAPVVGVGLNNFIVRLPEFWTVQSIYWFQPVHNIFLLVAAEAGLVGLAIFIWFLILTLKRLLIPKESRAASITNNFQLLLLLTVVLILGLTDHYWLTLQQTQLLFSLILGLSWKQ